jgi:prepilin-type N-terminal cleavage/methylation domain-containing protein
MRFRNIKVAKSAFTLMEVMIAIAVFCIGCFAILGLVASVMKDARLLDKPMVDAGVVANEIAQTNQLVEINGVSGDLSEFLGDSYKGYDYVYGIAEVGSNHLYQAEIYVTSDAPGKPVLSKLDVRFYRPLSPPGPLDFGSMQK